MISSLAKKLKGKINPSKFIYNKDLYFFKSSLFCQKPKFSKDHEWIKIDNDVVCTES
jgi:hypothetical protein